MRILPLIAVAALGFSTPSHAQSDWRAVGQALGKEGSVRPGEVYRVGLSRSDLKVTLDGVEIEPGLALGTWVAFKEIGDGAMLTGDLVLAEDEVNPVMERLLEGGVQVTALHKHLIGTGSTPMYMHVGGEGDPVEMAKTIRAALELTGTPLESASGAGDSPRITFDTEAVDQIMGAEGKADGGIYKYSFPRAEPVTMHGIEIPPAMGSAIAINLQPTGDGQVATTGDFVMTADEVQPVLQALRENGIQVMALHNHMLEEEPRLFFMHFWGNGDVQELARGLRAALDQIAIAKA
jgi:hypothetical protein